MHRQILARHVLKSQKTKSTVANLVAAFPGCLATKILIILLAIKDETVSIFILLASESLSHPGLLPGDPRLTDHGQQPQHQPAHVHSAQELVLNPDGSYNFGYELSDGAFSYANGDKQGEVFGGFGYKTADGGDVNVQYTAGVEGYKPSGDNLRSLSEVLQETASLSAPAGNSAPSVGYASAAATPSAQYAAPSSPANSFAYVVKTPSALYEVPSPPAAPKPKYAAPVETPAPLQTYAAPVETAPKPTYAAPLPAYAPVAQSAQSAALPADSPIFFRQPTVNQNDWILSKNYAFGYSSQDSSQSQESDDQGTVRGSYTTIDAKGNPLEVRYSAGANTGFVIENLDEVLQRSIPDSDQTNAQATHVTSSSIQQYTAQQPLGFGTRTVQAAATPSLQLQPPAPQNTVSYAYTTNTIQQSGQQQNLVSSSSASSSEGAVRGSYVTIDGKGNPLEVHYMTGPNIGFVIENLEEVQLRSVPTGEANQPSINPQQPAASSTLLPVINTQVKTQAAASPLPIALETPTLPQPVQPSVRVVKRPRPLKIESTQVFTSQDGQYHQEEENEEDSAPKDKSYSFAYQGDSGARQEESDANGNVRGHYSYVNAEGNQIAVRYSASPNGGFVVENQEELTKSLEKATVDGAAAAAAAKTADHRQQASLRSRQSPPAQAAPSAKSSSASTNQLAVSPVPVPGVIQAPSRSSISALSVDQQAQSPLIANVNSLNSQASSSSSVDHPTSYGGVSEGRNSQTSSTLSSETKSVYLPTSGRNLVVKKGRRVDKNNADEPKDGSFDFAFKAEDHSHAETADVDGERNGSYRYKTPEGAEVVVKTGRNEVLKPDQILPKGPTADVDSVNRQASTSSSSTVHNPTGYGGGTATVTA